MRIKAFVGAAVGVSLLLAVTTVASASADTTSTQPSTTDTGCQKGEWSDAATGQPSTFEAGAPAGVYVWHTTTGWHLRVTHPGHEEVTFTGRVQANQTIGEKRVADERDDKLKDGKNDKSFTFSFKNYGQIDGVDFRTDCATVLRFRFAMNAKSLPAKSIYIGHGNHHPRKDPFVIRRHKEAKKADKSTTTTTAPPSTTTNT